LLPDLQCEYHGHSWQHPDTGFNQEITNLTYSSQSRHRTLLHPFWAGGTLRRRNAFRPRLVGSFSGGRSSQMFRKKGLKVRECDALTDAAGTGLLSGGKL
ncbi:MAG: hypothetical protein ABFC77_08880, partial [Thermoguttaceae bacterium]